MINYAARFMFLYICDPQEAVVVKLRLKNTALKVQKRKLKLQLRQVCARSHTHTVVPECCKDNDESLQGLAKFDPRCPNL